MRESELAGGACVFVRLLSIFVFQLGQLQLPACKCCMVFSLLLYQHGEWFVLVFLLVHTISLFIFQSFWLPMQSKSFVICWANAKWTESMHKLEKKVHALRSTETMENERYRIRIHCTHTLKKTKKQPKKAYKRAMFGMLFSIFFSLHFASLTNLNVNL